MDIIGLLEDVLKSIENINIMLKNLDEDSFLDDINKEMLNIEGLLQKNNMSIKYKDISHKDVLDYLDKTISKLK